jgi:hypothetical protein
VTDDPLGEIIAIAYTDHIKRMLNSPMTKFIAEEHKQHEASLSRAYKLRRRCRNWWANSRFWLSNAIYKHEESDW